MATRKKNTAPKQIGVWMDHRQARLVFRQTDGTYTIEKIDSPYDPHPRVDGLGTNKTQWGGGQYLFSDNENKTNNTEIMLTRKYYQSLAKALAPYGQILLTGPTPAKTEFFNLLLQKKSFGGKRLAVETAGKMSDKQLVAMVGRYFGKEEEEKKAKPAARKSKAKKATRRSG